MKRYASWTNDGNLSRSSVRKIPAARSNDLATLSMDSPSLRRCGILSVSFWMSNPSVLGAVNLTFVSFHCDIVSVPRRAITV